MPATRQNHPGLQSMQLRIKQLVDSSEPKLKSSQMTISQDVTPTSQPGARLQQ